LQSGGENRISGIISEWEILMDSVHDALDQGHRSVHGGPRRPWLIDAQPIRHGSALVATGRG
jgi:hypothetical protein